MPSIDHFDPETRSLLAPFAVGAIGSLVALRFVPGATWQQRLGNVLSGTACAGFLTPAVIEWLQITGPGMRYALAFGIGMFGLSLAMAITHGIQELQLAKIAAGWLSRGVPPQEDDNGHP